MRRRRAATRLITSVVVSVVETHALFVYGGIHQNLWVLILTCIYYKYYAVAVDSSKRTGMGRLRQKVDINNAPLVDVTLEMRMPSDDVYLLQMLCS